MSRVSDESDNSLTDSKMAMTMMTSIWHVLQNFYLRHNLYFEWKYVDIYGLTYPGQCERRSFYCVGTLNFEKYETIIYDVKGMRR